MAQYKVSDDIEKALIKQYDIRTKMLRDKDHAVFRYVYPYLEDPASAYDGAFSDPDPDIPVPFEMHWNEMLLRYCIDWRRCGKCSDIGPEILSSSTVSSFGISPDQVYKTAFSNLSKLSPEIRFHKDAGIFTVFFEKDEIGITSALLLNPVFWKKMSAVTGGPQEIVCAGKSLLFVKSRNASPSQEETGYILDHYEKGAFVTKKHFSWDENGNVFEI